MLDILAKTGVRHVEATRYGNIAPIMHHIRCTFPFARGKTLPHVEAHHIRHLWRLSRHLMVWTCTHGGSGPYDLPSLLGQSYILPQQL